MGLNITHTMNSFQFENREYLKNTARDILNRKGSSPEAVERIINSTIFPESTYNNPQLAIIKAASQITINDSLKETLKYLKSQANKKVAKEPVLGELWNLVQKEYTGEIIEFEVDSSLKNIFAA